MTFAMHWALGGLLAWPVAVMFGRRMNHYQGGVPVVPYQRFVHDFPNLEPSRMSRNVFRWWSGLFVVVAGHLFARATVDP